ncbi:MAG: glycerate kinase, partial [Actinobacteria bacterium]
MGGTSCGSTSDRNGRDRCRRLAHFRPNVEPDNCPRPRGPRPRPRSPAGRPVGHDGAVPHLVAAPDKFRGTAAASEVAAAAARAGASRGWSCAQVPMADGGEGILDALGGRTRRTSVRGPLGEAVVAEWHLDDRTAVVEMAR